MIPARVGPTDAALVVGVIVAWWAIALSIEKLLERADARRARREHPSCRTSR